MNILQTIARMMIVMVFFQPMFNLRPNFFAAQNQTLQIMYREIYKKYYHNPFFQLPSPDWVHLPSFRSIAMALTSYASMPSSKSSSVCLSSLEISRVLNF